MSEKPRLGELLQKNGLVSKDTLDEALRIQVGGTRRLGAILVGMKILTEDQLADMLAQQLNITITPIGSIANEVRRAVPRYLCKKYGIIPISFGSNNTIQVAMADPSDEQAIRDLEQFTSRVVDPLLARQSEITAGIKKNIPFTTKDLVAPQTSTIFTRVAVAACFVFIIALGGFTYNYFKINTYGTISQTESSTIYKNHDLMVAFDADHRINLLGRGAYAEGYYSIAFTDIDILKAFLESRKTDFSENQRSWLTWVLSQVDQQDNTTSIATSN